VCRGLVPLRARYSTSLTSTTGKPTPRPHSSPNILSLPPPGHPTSFLPSCSFVRKILNLVPLRELLVDRQRRGVVRVPYHCVVSAQIYQLQDVRRRQGPNATDFRTTEAGHAITVRLAGIPSQRVRVSHATAQNSMICARWRQKKKT
jgi:hypothetical protein